jgi:hypothetical protein
MTTVKIKIPASVETMFADPRPWKQFGKYIYHNKVEKIGVTLATRAPNHPGHAQHKGELLRMLAAKRDGKINEAYVVAARLNGSSPPTYVCADDAEVVYAKLANRPTLEGKHGSFWVLQEYDIDYDAPF